jgi:hypothetical protein
MTDFVIGFSAKADHSWRNFGPSFTAAYNLNDTSNVYLKYAKRYRNPLR